ncbi:TPA: phage tail protein, partial [Morganella morganii]|nr:phage tail protein [Morganella morganii]
ISAPASEVIQITVKGKQNNITWGTTTVTPPTEGGK